MDDRRSVAWDVIIAVTVIVLVTASILTFGAHEGVAGAVSFVAVAGLVAVSATLLGVRFATREDRLAALQSHQVLETAKETLGLLRRGLDRSSADAVCRTVRDHLDVAAVSIETGAGLLGFVGTGDGHHGPAFQDESRHGEHPLVAGTLVLKGRDQLGCRHPECLLRAAIIVPLRVRREVVGSLAFFYTTPRVVRENEVVMAEGLARLLSTQLELAEVERQRRLAASMEMRALQAQIRPHFLFNTLNTIASFIRTDPTAAKTLLDDFSALYRRALQEPDQLITLGAELEFVRAYVDLESARFGDRLSVSHRADPAALSLPVPPFMVQPLVENAIQHAMKPDGAPLRIEISASVSAGELQVEVSDDGVGIPESEIGRVLEAGRGSGLGIALRNITDRVRGHFGHESGLHITSLEGEGTTVRLVIRPVPASGS